MFCPVAWAGPQFWGRGTSIQVLLGCAQWLGSLRVRLKGKRAAAAAAALTAEPPPSAIPLDPEQYPRQQISQNHRITEWQGLEGTSVGHLVQPSCRSRVTYSRPQRTLSRRVRHEASSRLLTDIILGCTDTKVTVFEEKPTGCATKAHHNVLRDLRLVYLPPATPVLSSIEILGCQEDSSQFTPVLKSRPSLKLGSVMWFIRVLRLKLHQ